MKGFVATAAALSLLATEASCHYIFQKIAVGGQAGGVYENIRENTNYNSPVTDLASNDLRCNEGGASGAATTVLEVKAGDEFTFTSDVAVYHQGPVSIFMSRAVGSVQDYDGSGDWFKTHDFGPTFGAGQASWPMRDTFTASIPTCIPNGEYLLRIQSLGIHNPYPAGAPQFYISCAQVNVTGGGGSAPTNTIKIPGAFRESDSGYQANIYDPNFTSYEIPGGAPLSC